MSSASATTTMPVKSRGIRLALIALVSLFVVYILAEIAFNPDKRQWDFRTYYYAVTTQVSGGNPYDVNQLNHYSDGLTVPPFLYPPPTLLFFRPFASVPFSTAYNLWFALKLLLAAGLIYLWRKYFFPEEDGLTYAVFLLLAFGATFYIDFVTGNVTILEQALFWLGIVFLLRGRPLEFCIALVLSSAFKLTPVVFVLLLPILNIRNAWKYVAGTVAAAAGATALSYFLNPIAWGEFFKRVSAADEAGNLGNPSTLSLFRDIAKSIADKWATTFPDAVPLIVYGAAVAIILRISFQAVRRIRRGSSADTAQVIVFLSCITFALIMPRFKTYSFMILLPPALYVLRRSANLPAFAVLVALLALTVSTPFPVSPYLRMFWMYYPLSLGFLIWGLMLRHVKLSTFPDSTQAAV